MTEENLIACLEVRTAGDPDEKEIVFTDLTSRELSTRMETLGTPVGHDAIDTWLDDAGIRFRQIRKDVAGGEHPDRDAQFHRISELIDVYESAGNPWFSMDTKAKEHLGMLYRKGRVRCSSAFQAFDHDFPSWADGVVIPHGIYDRKLNLGHLKSRAVSRYDPVRVRQFQMVLESHRQATLSQRDFDPADVRWRWQQCRK